MEAKEQIPKLVLATPGELSKIRDRLKSLLPDSFTTYGALDILLRYKTTRKDAVYHDDKSSLVVVLLKDSEDGPVTITLYWDLQKEDEKYIVQMLLSLPYSWSKPFLLYSTPCTLAEKVDNMIQNGQLGDGSLKNNQPIHACLLLKLSTTVKDLPRLPPGFKLRHTQENYAKHLHSFWAFNFIMTPESYRDMLNVFPGYAVVQTQNGDDGSADKHPVSWTHLSMLNTITNTFTMPESRRLGLSKVVTAALANHLIKESGEAYAFVGVNNVLSLNLHKQLGFTEVRKLGFQIYKLT